MRIPVSCANSRDLRQMALRSAAEQNEYQTMLADENILQEALDELRGGYSNASIDQGEELRRLQRDRFLNARNGMEGESGPADDADLYRRAGPGRCSKHTL